MTDENNKTSDEMRNDNTDSRSVESTDGTVSEGIDIVPEQKKVNFTESFKTTEPLTKDVTLNETLQLFRESYSTVAKVLDSINSTLNQITDREEALSKKLRNQGKELTDKDGSSWYRTVIAALAHAQINQTGEEALSREDADWQQVLEYEGKTIRAGQPKQSAKSGFNSPEEKRMYIARKAGTGIVFDVPLYHSGIWVRLTTPPDVAQAMFQHQISQLKVSLGSDTKGMAFSNISQAIVIAAVEFALRYVIDSNINYTSPSDFKDKISVLDIPILMWGFAVTIYPKGYPYSHPCIADPLKCQYVTKELLNLNRLQWTDTVSLSNHQRKVMARRFEPKLTDDDLKQYQNERIRGNNRMVWFGDTGVTLKIPTVQEYDDAGRQWIDNIIAMTQGAFNEPPHGANRDNFITRLGIATTARQYTHWVASIHDRDEDGVEQLIADDDETITSALDHVFSTEEFSEHFFKEVNKFMDDSIVSMIAIPSFNCPQCNSPAATKFHERFAHLVPIDVVTTFFTLVNRKLN